MSPPAGRRPDTLDDRSAYADRRRFLVPVAYGFLSTYPPTQCGLATFSAAMVRSLTTPGSGDRGGVVRVVDGPTMSARPNVVGHLDRTAGSAARAASALNTFDVAIVQHDFEIYSGDDGEDLLDVLEAVRIPVIVVAHAVLAEPTPHQRQTLERVVAAADAVVTMTVAARDRLIQGYGVDSTKVSIIPHGADVRGSTTFLDDERPMILTWGLLGPGKGIEWAVDGLQRIRRLCPLPRYVVAGQTHPRVRTRHGERYRLQLGLRAKAGGVSNMVSFPGSYLDEQVLAAMIQQASVVVLPYDSREQATSGVLVEAIAAGKPVIATRFPHAVEVLSSGAGILVPQCDGTAIGDAMYRVLTDPDLARNMSDEAHRLAPAMSWSAVAGTYRHLAHQLLADGARSGRLLPNGATV
jgi:glycosyltransferase involved in cell wall biosynthesis